MVTVLELRWSRAMNSPSPAVAGKGAFGAALMVDPSFPSTLRALRSSVAEELNVPVTLKCRIGVDEYVKCGRNLKMFDNLSHWQL